MTNQRVEPVFNAIAHIYDNIRFVREPAQQLVIHTKVKLEQLVLDVACGTGWATMAAARAVGNHGRVIGIDVADKLLDVAREKATSAGLLTVEYRVGDAEALEFSDATFDAVICASSIFFLKDIPKALQEWHRVLKIGGTIAFSSFGASYAQPVSSLLLERLTQYDGQAPPIQQPMARTDTADKCRELLKHTGFEEIEITTEQLGYYLPDAKAYWQEMTSTIMKPRLARLSPVELERFKAEHLAEVEYLRTDQGIWFDVPTLFSIAKKR